MRPHLPALASIRFIAALHVYFFHLSAFKLAAGPTWWQAFVSTAAINVNMFFVLSGFILVYSYVGRQFTAGEFWRARFWRIYPAYITALLLSLPIFLFVLFKVELTPELAWIQWFKDHLLITMSSVLLLVQSWIPSAALGWNSVTWSLSVEAFFYLLFPVSFILLLKRSSITLFTLLIACWLVSLATSLGYQWLQPDGVAWLTYELNQLTWFNVIRFNPIVRLPEFIAGMCTGLLFLRSPLQKTWATPLVLLGFAGILSVIVFSAQIPYQVLHNGILTPAFAAIVFGLALRPNWIRLLEFRWLRLLGEASYSFYLTHSLVIAVFFQPQGNRYQPQSWIMHLLCLTIAIGLAVAIYLCIEVPCLKRSKRAKSTAQVKNPESLALAP